MESIWSQFMQVYFWVFIAVSISGSLLNYYNENYKELSKNRLATFNFWNVVAITLFILSFKY